MLSVASDKTDALEAKHVNDCKGRLVENVQMLLWLDFWKLIIVINC